MAWSGRRGRLAGASARIGSVAVGLFAFGGVLGAACGPADRCDPDSFRTRCEGNAIVSCSASSGEFMRVAMILREKCFGHVCVHPPGERPFCAEDSEPNPACEGQNAFCDGEGARNQCNLLGFVTSINPCAAGTCIVEKASGQPFCTVSDEPDPQCPSPEGRSSFCDEDRLVTCIDGFRLSSSPCAIACVEFRGFADACVSEGPDPRCEPDGRFCQGVAALVHCEESRTSSVEVCELGCSKGECL
jgi:hypothetical protein